MFLLLSISSSGTRMLCLKSIAKGVPKIRSLDPTEFAGNTTCSIMQAFSLTASHGHPADTMQSAGVEMCSQALFDRASCHRSRLVGSRRRKK